MAAPDNTLLKSRLRAAAAGLAMHPPEEFPISATRPERGELTRRRLRGDAGAGNDSCLLELRRDADGVLRWQDGFAGRPAVFPSATGPRRGFRRAPADDSEFVDQLQFDRLKPNEISGWLDTLDQKLTPLPRGLLRLDAAGTAWDEKGKLPASGRILLLLHGTFSSAANFLRKLNATPHGQEFLKAALKNYSAVFAFEHSTLSVSPWLNAMELTRALESTKADVDIVAHSRGGLVARWWADSLDRTDRKRRSVLVGSPLAGTSGASPAAIRHTMDLFTNVAEALETAAGLGSSMFPLLSVVAGLLKIVGSVTGVVAKLPIADAVIAAIPGLCGQSATSNNFELQTLRRSAGLSGTTHYAIRSDFQPVSEGWKFWRYFTKLDHAANLAADRFIFRQANDLVVDYDHMASFADTGTGATLPKARVLDLGTNPDVWHCNYFRQETVTAWIRKKLDWND